MASSLPRHTGTHSERKGADRVTRRQQDQAEVAEALRELDDESYQG